MKHFLATLADGLRVAFLRHPRGAAIMAGAGTFLAVVVAYLAATFAQAWIAAAPPHAFDPAGVTTVLCDSLLTLAAAWLLAELAGRRDVVWGVASILLAATIAIALAIHWPLDALAAALARREQYAAALLVALLSRAWWFLVLLVYAHWLAPRSLPRVVAAAVLAYAVSAAAWWWLPASPPLVTAAANAAAGDENGADASADDDQADAEADAANAEPDFDAEQVMFEQRARLDAALARLQPRTPGKPNLFVVAFAGDAAENVFRNEAEYAARLFAQRFDADGRTLVLENHAATVQTRPLATWTNLHYALDAIAKKMDPAEDILLLYLTTHGSAEHQLLVDLDPLPLDQIEPVDLADALKTAPRIRWKVLVVNACYSGGFVDALRDDSTMVVTSARADRTSFGCGADADITWFGKAFLADALNRTTSLREAFDLAKASIAAQESEQKEEPSEPQIASSAAIEAKLAQWQSGLRGSAAVPFAPAADTAPNGD